MREVVGVLETIRRNRAIIGGVVLLAAVALIGRAFDRDNDPPVSAALAVTTTTDASTTTRSATQPDSEVPPVDCTLLLTTQEREVALGIPDRPADQRDSMMSSGAEACVETLVSDDQYFVGVAPGNPDDFESGEVLNDTTGERVEIADGGLWVGAAHSGVLSVRRETPLGALHFRIVLGRPDLDDTARRGLAMELAGLAMPRFPGVEVEPEVVTVFDQAPDQSTVGFVDNLLAGVEAEEWSLGEGLVATLRLFAGEVGANEVIPDGELIDYESTGIMEMARDYLEDGPEAEARAEIERLLDLIVFSNEELEAMAGIGPATAALPGAPETVTAQTEEDCARLIGEAPGVSVCLEVESFVINGKEFRVFRPAASLPQSGWAQQHFESAATAIKESVPKLDGVGATPRVNLVFSVSSVEIAEANYVAGEPCGVFAYTQLQSFTVANFKQVIAHEVGHCFNGETFVDQRDLDYQTRKWWEEGVADYWSNFVYPQNNLEWRTLDRLTGKELATTIFDRTYDNAVFFQYLEEAMDVDGIDAVISNLPGSGGVGDQLRAMASFPGMDETYHEFARVMADSQVFDTSGERVPYRPVGWDLAVSGPTQVPFPVPAFGVRRLHITLPPGLYGCYEAITTGEQKVSWREGAPGQPAPWDGFGPAELQGETTLVVTAVEEGAQFTLDVYEVDSDPDCDDLEEPEECDLELICDPSGYFFQIVSSD
jgi:hypothetical protein